jgi:nitrite reductase/ring-hydroxylating ferredoxin subunit
MSFVRFAPLSEIPTGGSCSVRIGLRRIAVFNVDGELFAIEDACAHMKSPLSSGTLRCRELTCSWHGWRYDIATGRRIGKEAGKVRTFPVKVDGETVYVDPEAGSEPARDERSEGREDELPPII